MNKICDFCKEKKQIDAFCKEKKQIDAFYKTKNNYAKICKNCHKEKMRKRTIENKIGEKRKIELNKIKHYLNNDDYMIDATDYLAKILLKGIGNNWR